MPSPRAQLATVSHRRELGLLAAAITRRVNRIAMAANTADIDLWWNRAGPEVVALVARGHDAAAALARRYLATHAAAEGVLLRPAAVTANTAELTTSLRVTGPVAFKTNMRISEDPAVARRVMGQMLGGSAQRLTLGGDRATVMRTFTESEAIAGWRRVGGGCPFCTMLISRGAVYSKNTADFPSHDSCKCSAVPLYRREPEPESVRRLAEQWGEVTAGATGPDKLRAWREHLTETAAAGA